jgi:hypothetical protein
MSWDWAWTIWIEWVNLPFWTIIGNQSFELGLAPSHIVFFNWYCIGSMCQSQPGCYNLRKSVLFFVRIRVQYRKSVKNVSILSTNHDLFLKKEHFFQIRYIFDSKKRTSLASLRYWTWICSFFVFLFQECSSRPLFWNSCKIYLM